jgi:hypothetical protein
MFNSEYVMGILNCDCVKCANIKVSTNSFAPVIFQLYLSFFMPKKLFSVPGTGSGKHISKDVVTYRSFTIIFLSNFVGDVSTH